MNERFTHDTVTFAPPFPLHRVDGTFPRGRYSIEATEGRLDGLSSVAYRRVSTAYVAWQRVDIGPANLASAKQRGANINA